MPIQVLASEPTDATFNAYVRVDQGGFYFMTAPTVVVTTDDDGDDEDGDDNEQILDGEMYVDVYLAFHAEDYELTDPKPLEPRTTCGLPWEGWVQIAWLEVPLPVFDGPGSWTSPAVGLCKVGDDVCPKSGERRTRRPLLGFYAAHEDPPKDPYTEQIGSASIWVP